MRRVSIFVLVAACAFLAGCGGSKRLSAADYRARLATIAKESDAVQHDVEQALSAKTVDVIVTRLHTFAGAEDRLGDEVGKLKAPKDADAANAQLAKGEHDLAAQVRALLPKLAKLTSAKQALAFLQNQANAPRAGGEVDAALAKLKRLGYTKGS